MSKVSDGWITDFVVEYFCEDFADVFASEVFAEKGAGEDDSLIDTTNVNFFVADVDDAG